MLEHEILTVSMSTPVADCLSSIKQVWIGQDEVPAQGQSIEILLNDMEAKGWILTSAEARPSEKDLVCKYKFQRST